MVPYGSNIFRACGYRHKVFISEPKLNSRELGNTRSRLDNGPRTGLFDQHIGNTDNSDGTCTHEGLFKTRYKFS